MFASWQESYDKPRQCAEKQSHYSPDKGSYSQSYGLPIELDCKEGRVLKNWCLQIMVLEKTPENPLASKEIKPVNLKRNQPWILIGRTDAEAETPIIWSSDVKNWLTGQVPDAGKDWGQKEKRASENKMVGWHHWHNRHEFEQTVGNSEGQGRLAYCSPWGHKTLDST